MSRTSTPVQVRPAARPVRRAGNVVRDLRDLPRVTQGRIAQRLSAAPAPNGSRQPGGRDTRLRPMRPAA